jgi:hypothetical protein
VEASVAVTVAAIVLHVVKQGGNPYLNYSGEFSPALKKGAD